THRQRDLSSSSRIRRRHISTLFPYTTLFRSLEEKKVEVSGNRTLLLSKLQQLTHISSQELEEIEYELAELKVEDIPLSADNRSELQALKAGINAQEYVLKKEKGARMPTVFAFGSAN